TETFHAEKQSAQRRREFQIRRLPIRRRKPMSRNRSKLLLVSLIVAATVALSGCANVPENTKSPVAANTEPSSAGKIPITTSSEEARKEFLQGRDLNEKLLIQDSIQHFDKAISLDPNFASAELNRAVVSPTGKEFF